MVMPIFPKRNLQVSRDAVLRKKAQIEAIRGPKQNRPPKTPRRTDMECDFRRTATGGGKAVPVALAVKNPQCVVCGEKTHALKVNRLDIEKLYFPLCNRHYTLPWWCEVCGGKAFPNAVMPGFNTFCQSCWVGSGEYEWLRAEGILGEVLEGHRFDDCPCGRSIKHSDMSKCYICIVASEEAD